MSLMSSLQGDATGICRERNCNPREVYTRYLDELKAKLQEGVKIPTAFGCDVNYHEKYHFKDIGWLHLNPYRCDERYLEKFKRGIKVLNIEHKYPLPDKLK